MNADGTKIHANASKHKAVSYKYAKEQIFEKLPAELIEKKAGSEVWKTCLSFWKYDSIIHAIALYKQLTSIPPS